MGFNDLNLDAKLLQGILEAGYEKPTPVQEKVLDYSIEGNDLYVQSQTGTGKTAAYLIPVIQKLVSREIEGASQENKVPECKALIMVPTRELAVQVQEETEKLAKYTSLKCEAFYGGVGYDKQVAALKKGVDIIIGTPGRVLDLCDGNQMDLSKISFLIIDEADRMFDMGFYPDLRSLLKIVPSSEKRNTMLFSATLNSYVKNLAWEYTRNPKEILIEADNIVVDEIDQELLHVSSSDKIKLLVGLIKKENPESLIIFCNTKKTCEIISKRLKLNEIKNSYLIGDLPQSKRLSIMNRFKSGELKYLVATDVAARGIDVNDLAMVINYDLPSEVENYVHRIGRTARAGKKGKAYTFCSEQDVYSLPAIERYIEKQIPSTVAAAEMFAEDKSENIYIELDSYKENYNDKSSYGRKKQKEFESRNKKSDKAQRSASRGRGRYSSENEKSRKEYKRDRRGFTNEEEAVLATLSTEERMKLYKEKYAKNFGSQASVKTEKTKSSKKNKNNSYKKSNKPNKNSNAAKFVNKNNQQKNKVEKNEKKGIFSKIINFFSKRK